MTAAEFVSRLGSDVKPLANGKGWRCRCPAHDDKNPSLSVNDGRDGKLLLHCYGGCKFEDILAAAGMGNRKPADKQRPARTQRCIVATYDYTDPTGKLVYQVCRFEPKDFLQRRPDSTAKDGWSWSVKGVQRVLYRLPEVLAAVLAGRTVYVVEGEKDVDALIAAGFIATTGAGGAGKWTPSYSESLRGADVVIIPDKDKPGRGHAQKVATALKGIAALVKLLELPGTSKDVSDWLASGVRAGRTAAELKELLELLTLQADQVKVPLALETAGVTSVSDKLTEFDYANLLADRLPPCRTVAQGWYVYRDGTWARSERSTLRPKAQQVLPEGMRTARRERALLDHLEGRWQIPLESFSGFFAWDSEAVLINCSNGVLRVPPRGEPELLPHAPEHMFTLRTAASYNPRAGGELFQRILNETLPDSGDRSLLQICAGNFLLPDCRFEVALVSYGEAGRGKSTMAESIVQALGGELVTRLSLSQLCDPRSYHLPKLRFAAVNLGTELDTVAVDESANFKTLVSGEPMEARPIYGAPFTMRTACKLWFLANGLPRFKNGTEAELRRTRFIRFDRLPTKKDVGLKHRLIAERDAVFNWAVLGLQRLLNLTEIPRGGNESVEVHERFKVSNDPLGAFVAQRCELGTAHTEGKPVLHDAFTTFCEEFELPPDLSGRWFFRRLYERFPQIRETRRQQGGSRLRSVQGIRVLRFGEL